MPSIGAATNLNERRESVGRSGRLLTSSNTHRPKLKIGITGISTKDGRRTSITLGDFAKGGAAIHKKVAEVRKRKNQARRLH